MGREAITRYLLRLLATDPRHRAALRHSRTAGGRRAATDRQLRAMRDALLAAASYSPPRPPGAHAAAAAAAAGGPLDPGGGDVLAAAAAAADWQPGDDDSDDEGGGPSADDVDAWRLELLLRGLGVAGARNPNQQDGALARVLGAWRTGLLGKYCLDDVG